MNDAQGKQKLNLGSGKSTPNHPDYLNVDVADTFWEGQVIKPDLQWDMTKLEFPPETFTEIKAHDCLDHIEYTQCLALIPRIYKWLKPNGALDIHLPNLRTLAGVLATQENHHALVWMYGTDGAENFYPTNHIRWSYSKQAITKILEDSGFVVSLAINDCNEYAFRIIAVKR